MPLAADQRMGKVFLAALLILIHLSGSTGCTREQPPAQTTTEGEPASSGTSGSGTESSNPKERAEPVGFDMRNVRMRAAPDVTLNVEHLQGRLIARNQDLPVFDDLQSFYIAVEHAQ